MSYRTHRKQKLQRKQYSPSLPRTVITVQLRLLQILLQCSSYLGLLALYVLYPAYLVHLLRCHALPAVRYNSVNSEGTLGAGWVLGEEVAVQHVCHFRFVVVVRLLFLHRLLGRPLTKLRPQINVKKVKELIALYG